MPLAGDDGRRAGRLARRIVQAFNHCRVPVPETPVLRYGPDSGLGLPCEAVSVLREGGGRVGEIRCREAPLQLVPQVDLVLIFGGHPVEARHPVGPHLCMISVASGQAVPGSTCSLRVCGKPALQVPFTRHASAGAGSRRFGRSLSLRAVAGFFILRALGTGFGGCLVPTSDRGLGARTVSCLSRCPRRTRDCETARRQAQEQPNRDTTPAGVHRARNRAQTARDHLHTAQRPGAVHRTIHP